SRLRQAAGGDGAAKAGADDHYVIRRTHPPTPVGASPDRCHWVLLACSCQHLIPYPLQALKPVLGVRHLAASEYPTHFLGQQIRRFQVNKVADALQWTPVLRTAGIHIAFLSYVSR